jgi:hypothetical protein
MQYQVGCDRGLARNTKTKKMLGLTNINRCVIKRFISTKKQTVFR